MKLNNLTGHIFGRLTVVGRTVPMDRRTRWMCSCSCGGIKNVLSENLLSGNTQSCGCLSKENPHNIRHGLRRHPLYGVWKGIKARCYNKKNKAYHNYGGRGVVMCKEWIDNPEAFINWALDSGWEHGMEVDKDKKAIEKGVASIEYSPLYCSILTNKENMNYRSDNRRITAFGESKTMAQWTDLYQLPPKAIYSRLKIGWDEEKAISTPILKTWSRQ